MATKIPARASTSGGTTRTAVASASTSVTIDVSADGDGEYLFGFDGVLATAVSTSKQLQLQMNGGAIPTYDGNYIEWQSTAAVGAAAATGTGTVLLQPGPGSAPATVGVKGRFSSFAAVRSSLSSQFAGVDTANWSGVTSATYVPGSTLTAITLLTTQASGLTSGTFWVRKVA